MEDVDQTEINDLVSSLKELTDEQINELKIHLHNVIDID